MLFNSWVFFFFALAVFPLYYLLRTRRQQNVFLLAASYLFYSAWDWRFLALIAFSTIVDYVVGLQLDKTEEQKKRKALLLVSLVTNVGLLGLFKYFNFFAENFVALLEPLFGEFGDVELTVLEKIVLPVGISFYTFQTISYTVDVYWRKIKPERDLLDYALFVSFFPQLVAGPIERAANLLPQIKGDRQINRTFIVEGLWLLLMGFFKKIVVADNIAAMVDEVFAQRGGPSGLQALFAMYGFTIVGYCDFAGYSDIARGLAKLMGINIVLNFNMPLIARNPSDFWRRWHISLSFWLRDYLYIPLGGNRKGQLRTYWNVTLVFFISGLWHGAQWTYVIWGLYNGLITAVHRYTVGERGWKLPGGRLADILIRIFYFHVTCFGLLLIRAQDMATFWLFIKRIFTDFYVDFNASALIFTTIFFSAVLGGIELWIRNADNPETRPGWNKGLGVALVSIMILMMLLFPPPSGQPFIYFQF